jgi:uncharacterized protein (TIGR02145 family)
MRTKLFKIAQAATLGIAITFTFSCSADDGGGGGGSNAVYGEPVDYDGETYKTVVIGNQTWMARNLNYNAEGSKCYNDDPANCTKYGRLYTWVTAMALPDSCDIGSNDCSTQINAKHQGICPSGWHIPSNADWDILLRYVDGISGTESPYNSETAGKYLKAASGWNKYSNGTDAYGFSALPGGATDGTGAGGFSSGGGKGFWWSASDKAVNHFRYACRLSMRSIGFADCCNWDVSSLCITYKYHLSSVRCLQD